MAARSFLPYGRQTIEQDDKDAVLKVLGSDYLTTGPEVPRFELAMCGATKAAHAVSCNSATAGLHMAAMALSLGPADSVVVPSMTFLATANGPHYTGAQIVFADVDPETGLMTEQTLRAAIARCHKPVRAIFPVHLNGHQVDMQAIASVAAEFGAALVEDACHALGGTQPDQAGNQVPTGSCAWSDLTVFSFHPVKAIAMGEGGAVTTQSQELANGLMLARNHGMTREQDSFKLRDLAFDIDGTVNPWFYEMHTVGYNYRAPDINCALGTSQLAKLDRFLARRVAIADLYDAQLSALAPALKPVPRSPFGTSGWHLYAVLIDFEAIGKSRRQVMQELRDRQIGSQVHYIPVHKQPYYRDLSPNLSLPGADRYYDRVLSLPLYPGLADDDVRYVADSLVEIVGGD
jgi:UDP-4-amino-4,6-dideoxy-N-acetyl-beta-L-altrosamine transaminase